jgi:hypothetical protein
MKVSQKTGLIENKVRTPGCGWLPVLLHACGLGSLPSVVVIKVCGLPHAHSLCRIATAALARDFVWPSAGVEGHGWSG